MGDISRTFGPPAKRVCRLMVLAVLAGSSVGVGGSVLGSSSPLLARQLAAPSQKGVYDVVPPDYTIHEPPPLLDGRPVPVQFSVSVKNIPNLDELRQELSMELNLRIYWTDTRLQVDKYFDTFPNNTYMHANPTLLTQIWTPDVYTDYTKSVTAPRILAAPSSLRIYPDHMVRYSARITMQFACPMDFRMYPADSQSCNMSLESYGFTRDKITFAWKQEGKPTNIEHRLQHFDFNFTFSGDRENVNFPSGSYPAITMTVLLHRRISYHLLQTYVPSLLFVIVSWLSFLVPPESVPGRMAICMTTLLTLTAMFAAVRQSTPSVSYVKALDIWMVVCIFSVFLTLVEYTIVLRLTKNLTKKASSPAASARPKSPPEQPLTPPEEQEGVFHKFSGEGVIGPPSVSPPYCCVRLLRGGESCWRHPTKHGILVLETASCIIVPGSFVFFNLIYWPWLYSNANTAENNFM